MARNDLFARTVEAGRDVGQRSQERLEVLVGQLQRLSEDQLDQVAAMVGELRDRSVLSGEQLMASVDRRIREQMASVGLARRADLKALEARVEALEARAVAVAKGAGKSSAKSAGKASGTRAAKPAAKAARKSPTKAPTAKTPAVTAKASAKASRTKAAKPPTSR